MDMDSGFNRGDMAIQISENGWICMFVQRVDSKLVQKILRPLSRVCLIEGPQRVCDWSFWSFSRFVIDLNDDYSSERRNCEEPWPEIFNQSIWIINYWKSKWKKYTILELAWQFERETVFNFSFWNVSGKTVCFPTFYLGNRMRPRGADSWVSKANTESPSFSVQDFRQSHFQGGASM